MYLCNNKIYSITVAKSFNMKSNIYYVSIGLGQVGAANWAPPTGHGQLGSGNSARGQVGASVMCIIYFAWQLLQLFVQAYWQVTIICYPVETDRLRRIIGFIKIRSFFKSIHKSSGSMHYHINIRPPPLRRLKWGRPHDLIPQDTI